jgi:hypothetical protein
VWVKVEPRFDRLRSCSKFEELLRRMGLFQRASRSTGSSR